MTIPGNAFRSVGRSLIRLNLKNNRMTNIVDPEAFGGLKALEELNLFPDFKPSSVVHFQPQSHFAAGSFDLLLGFRSFLRF